MPSIITRTEARETIRAAAARVRYYNATGLVGEVETSVAVDATKVRGAHAVYFRGAGANGFDQLVVQPFPKRDGSPDRYVVDLARIDGERSAVTPGERARDLHADCARCSGSMNPRACREDAARAASQA